MHVRPVAERLERARAALTETVTLAGTKVPYYRDLFQRIGFDPGKLAGDVRYLGDLPVLTKEIIREQGQRMLSQSLEGLRHHACKTGGSTGQSAIVWYDQPAADRSAAVTLWCRERIGKARRLPETHLAARFADAEPAQWPSREDFKCFAMNRANIFFDRTDEDGLEEMWTALRRRPPFLLHGHPSTVYALALHVEARHGPSKAFEVFESSGELLEPYQRAAIQRALRCRVVDRYGLAELGVVAYETGGNGLRVLESEAWPESRRLAMDAEELVFTGLRNPLMPLIRYATGDLGTVALDKDGFRIDHIVGRIHDAVPLGGATVLTHHIQDVLDHRVGGIQEFQIDLRTVPPTLRIVAEPNGDREQIAARVERHFPAAFTLEFAGHGDLVRVGDRAKFRHVVPA